MLKGIIDLLILSIVKEKDEYGYGISRKIKEKTDGSFEIQEATLYLALKRLENQGALSSYWGKESHGSRRKYYEVTNHGYLLLERNLSDWFKITEMVQRFL